MWPGMRVCAARYLQQGPPITENKPHHIEDKKHTATVIGTVTVTVIRDCDRDMDHDHDCAVMMMTFLKSKGDDQ